MSTPDRDLARTRDLPEPAALDTSEVVPGRTARTDGLHGPGGVRSSGIVMRKAERDAEGVAEGAADRVFEASASSGDALPDAIRSMFEASLGADLSGVRVHTGPESAAAAESVSARAYATGNDIHFGAGQYAPGTSDGEFLLAHEVAHTVQQQGAAPTRQNKLEVSSEQDAAEVDADRAAGAMVAGTRADLGTTIAGVSRKIFRDMDPGTGVIQGAGDEAEMAAKKTPLTIDNASVSTDASRVGEILKDIDAQKGNLKAAEDDNSNLESQYAPVATNAATHASLEVFNQKLDVSAVDTSSFAVQFRNSYADYKRLTAEASEYLAHIGVKTDNAIGTVGDGFSKTPGLAMGAGQAGLERFRAARANLNTAATKMDGQLTAARGAANLLQAAINKARGAAAAATGKDAATKLAAVRAEIAEVAGNVATVIKVCSAVAGLAGTGGATGAIGTAKASVEPTTVQIEGADVGALKGTSLGDMLEKKQTVDIDAAAASKLALMKAMGTDVASLGGGGGGPEKWAEMLVTAIGNYANKDKISHLQQTIAKAAAEEATFNAAGDAQAMTGYQDQMEAASKQLSTLLTAYAGARKELEAASQSLMTELSKGGKKGKDQAKGVLFLTDADKFEAQVTTSISVGENQQKNLKQAAEDRKGLRGTDNTTEDKDRRAQYYFRCNKYTTPGKLWGTNTSYKLEKVWVTFQDHGLDSPNAINQGGAGSVEGTGGAGDAVAQKLDTLKKARDEVKILQTKVGDAMGMGGPGLNA